MTGHAPPPQTTKYTSVVEAHVHFPNAVDAGVHVFTPFNGPPRVLLCRFILRRGRHFVGVRDSSSGGGVWGRREEEKDEDEEEEEQQQEKKDQKMNM